MTAHTGDTIVVDSGKVAQPGRTGVIEEVLQSTPPRFRVRWSDGRESIFAPSAGGARIEQRKKNSGKKQTAAKKEPAAKRRAKA